MLMRSSMRCRDLNLGTRARSMLAVLHARVVERIEAGHALRERGDGVDVDVLTVRRLDEVEEDGRLADVREEGLRGDLRLARLFVSRRRPADDGFEVLPERGLLVEAEGDATTRRKPIALLVHLLDLEDEVHLEDLLVRVAFLERLLDHPSQEIG